MTRISAENKDGLKEYYILITHRMSFSAKGPRKGDIGNIY